MKIKSKLSNILLIEDNVNDVLLIKIALEKAAIHAYLSTITNGEEAINYIRKLKSENEFPSLILLDINLPKVTGLEVLKSIKLNKITSEIPTVVFTSSGLKSDMEYSYFNKANLYIHKPNNINSFKETMIYIKDHFCF